MRRPAVVTLLAALSSLAAWAQPTDWLDDFSGPRLEARWTQDVSSRSHLSLDPQHQFLVLRGKENCFNHIETELPADVSLVQADLNNVGDPSASWSPGLALYWGPEAHLRVMVSLHYGLRLELAPGAEVVPLAARLQPVPDTWYRQRHDLGQIGRAHV